MWGCPQFLLYGIEPQLHRTDGRMITDVQLFYAIKFSVEKAEVIVM